MTAIWNASAVTPLATDRIPVDVSSSGAASRWTGQNIADIGTIIGGTVTALGSINTNTALDLSLGGYFSATVTGNLTFSITNVPASAGVTFVLALTNGGAFTVTLPGSVTIIGGSPVLSAAGTDWLVFRTLDGGTAWTLEVVGNPRDADLATWATVTPGTGIAAALAVNVGTAGAPVINGGALGTPSSGNLANCTGYPGGSGDVVGPASSTDNAVARFDLTTGKLLQNTSNVTIADTGAVSITPDANAKALTIASHTHTASNPAVDVAQTWNNAAVAFDCWKVNITSTASAATSHFATFQVGGSTVLAFQKNATIKMNGTWIYSSGSGALKVGNGQDSSADGSFSAGRFVTGGNTIAIDDLGFAGIGLASTYKLFWSSTGVWSGAGDLFLYRDGANTLAQRNGTNGQTSRIYGTYTDASNYVRASLAATSTAVTLAEQVTQEIPEPLVTLAITDQAVRADLEVMQETPVMRVTQELPVITATEAVVEPAAAKALLAAQAALVLAQQAV